ncbi:GntR family transcriptional regulator [Peribacillus saganii]|uniref:GntR family transcriptional regulator n=1 Tax=Peribacillus saganii TaxID=2303992 RepID=A0A372LSN6_9BACI|nr:GntR family transcriptional regulator [Peribacillus saganii]RFU71209.1 GntR family transcriptional regulator [Peribacillus saganii]
MVIKSDFYHNVRLETGTLSDQVKNHIYNAIIRGELKPGEMIVESLVAEKLGISRAPVREAMRMLEAKGLVNIAPRKGIFVSQLSVKELKEMYEVRLNLEMLALKNSYLHSPDKTVSELEESLEKQQLLIDNRDFQAYMNENIRFHDIFITNSGNSYLISTLQNIEELTLRYRASSMNLSGRLEKSLNDHLAICNFFKSGTIEKALKTLENHIISSALRLQEELSKDKSFIK